MKHTKKTDRELLRKLLHLFVDKREVFQTGLCYFVKECWLSHYISNEQRGRLLILIETYKPKGWRRHYPYYFTKYNREVRLDWIVNIIVKLSTPARKRK